MRCSALPCSAVLCGAVLCHAVRAMPHALLYLLFRARYQSKCHTRYRYYYTRFVRTILALLKPQKGISSSAQLSYSSAAPCGAVRCRAFFPAVRCGAALCFLSNIQYQISCELPGTRYRYVRVYSVFVLSSFDCPLSVVFMPPPLPQITPVLPIRMWHGQQAHSTAQGNQLRTGSAWHYQIASCTTLWALSFRPLHN